MRAAFRLIQAVDGKSAMTPESKIVLLEELRLSSLDQCKDAKTMKQAAKHARDAEVFSVEVDRLKAEPK
ncbi:hypothetical protein HX878_22215 [Pseudomonas veronii]|uniref:hypothetical protein n=1 Tax=Pseudomonas veronii TaxID=76761 RepID=UPI0015A18135|nr:hypothetical protein [Pseudomonas veronii]NWD57442.1 hypothetical protein [Pseudomonas veronii]